jgi:drug/metabolite transporter (DMT)-like permease
LTGRVFAGVMQVFAVTYLKGGLIILVMQSAIPISMVITRVMLKTVYKAWHYIGSLIVVAGIGGERQHTVGLCVM